MTRQYKLQGGIEYLAVYGWASLVVVTALFGLYQLGVFSSNRLAPSASAGSCRVFRSTSSAGIVISLTGLCSGRSPKFVAVFNGASYIEEGSMKFSSTDFSASFWVQIQTPVTTFNGILDKGSQSSPKDWFFWSSGTTCGNGQGVIFNAGPGRLCWPFGNQGWHFVVGVYNTTNTREYLYVDGALVGNTKGSRFTAQTYPLLIGAESNFKNMFSGSIANIQVYNSSLDQATIQAMYKEGIGGAPIRLRNLLSWWPLNGDTIDYSGNPNTQINRVGVSFTSGWANGYTQP